MDSREWKSGQDWKGDSENPFEELKKFIEEQMRSAPDGAAIPLRVEFGPEGLKVSKHEDAEKITAFFEKAHAMGHQSFDKMIETRKFGRKWHISILTNIVIQSRLKKFTKEVVDLGANLGVNHDVVCSMALEIYTHCAQQGMSDHLEERRKEKALKSLKSDTIRTLEEMNELKTIEEMMASGGGEEPLSKDP